MSSLTTLVFTSSLHVRLLSSWTSFVIAFIFRLLPDDCDDPTLMDCLFVAYNFCLSFEVYDFCLLASHIFFTCSI